MEAIESICDDPVKQLTCRVTPERLKREESHVPLNILICIELQRFVLEVVSPVDLRKCLPSRVI